jgi:hypothetical protein
LEPFFRNEAKCNTARQICDGEHAQVDAHHASASGYHTWLHTLPHHAVNMRGYFYCVCHDLIWSRQFPSSCGARRLWSTIDEKQKKLMAFRSNDRLCQCQLDGLLSSTFTLRDDETFFD